MTTYQMLLEQFHKKQKLNECVRALLAFDEGELLFRELFKILGVAQLPQEGLRGEDLHENLGFLRAGQTLLSILTEGDPATVQKMLLQNEKERIDAANKDFLAEIEKEKYNV